MAFRKKYTFSQPKIIYYVGRGLGNALLVVILLFVSVLFVRGGFKFLRDPGVMMLLFFFFGLYFFYRFYISHSIYKITVDPDSNKVAFYLYRKDKPVEVDIKALRHVRVNGYLIFEFNNKKILYNNTTDTDLLKLINSLKKIEWGGVVSHLRS